MRCLISEAIWQINCCLDLGRPARQIFVRLLRSLLQESGRRQCIVYLCFGVELACSACACIGFLWGLWLPPLSKTCILSSFSFQCPWPRHWLSWNGSLGATQWLPTTAKVQRSSFSMLNMIKYFLYIYCTNSSDLFPCHHCFCRVYATHTII